MPNIAKGVTVLAKYDGYSPVRHTLEWGSTHGWCCSEKSDARQAGAVLEGVSPDAGDTVGDRDARQAGAFIEGVIPDAGDPIRDRDARQAAAASKGNIPDAGDAIGNRDARQAAAGLEGGTPDAGDRITSNGVRNYQFSGGCSITIGDGDLAVSRGPRQVI